MPTPLIIEVDSDLVDLIPLFLKSRQKDVQDLGKALAEGNFGALRLIGHSMKGAGSSFGFDAISDMGDRIEIAASGLDIATVQAQTEALTDYLARIDIKWV
jgi:HPt (histidine-containing phosphotransfer) domain-containing protein